MLRPISLSARLLAAAALSFAPGRLCAAEAAPAADAAAPVSYYKAVRPVLQAKCHGCHQPAKAKGDYVMTDFAKLMKGGEDGNAILAGNPDASNVVKLITLHEGKAEMPKNGDPLSEKEIAVIRRWIQEGASDDTPANAVQRFDEAHPPVYTMPPVVTSLDFSPDGRLLAVAGFHEVLLHKADGTGLVARLVGLSDRITSVKFSPDGTRLAVTGGLPARMGEVQIWDVAEKKLKTSIPVTYDTVYGVSWSPDGKLVACGCADKSLRAFDSTTGEQKLYMASHDDWVFDTVFAKNGEMLISVGRDQTTKSTEVATQRFIDNLTSITPGALKGGLAAVAKHPTREEILVGGADGAPQVYRVERQVQRRIGDNSNLIRKFPAMEGRIFAVAYSTDGKRIAAASSLDGKGMVNIYSADFDSALPDNIKNIYGKVSTSRSAEENAAVEKYQTDGAVLLKSVPLPAGQYTVTFSNDGSVVAAAGQDGKIRFISTADGSVSKEFVPVELSTPQVAAAEPAGTAAPVSARPAPDFIRDVNPVLSRMGCNQGTCHGAKDGKAGFKLSLRGYDPIYDIRAFTDDIMGRRTNVASADDSLMLMKGTAGVPHEGGQVMKPGDPYYVIVRDWIAAGAKLDLTSPRVTKITLEPQNPVADLPGAKTQFKVMAEYADGLIRDVTREAFIESGNGEVATHEKVGGLLTAVRRGEAPVLARYEGSYASTVLTVMGDRSGFVWQDPPANNRIDELVIAKLKRLRTLQSGLCTDLEFVRRTYLDLTGLPPSPEVIRAFEADQRDSRWKREELIDKLIGSPDFIEHWANKWADLLQCNGKFLGSEGARLFRDWIRGQVDKNVPWDQFARSVLTATGSNKDNPPAAYWKILREPAETMENTTHLFLATRFNCNKCHDHPFERWTQDQYYQTAAWFAQFGLDRDPASGDRNIGGSAVENAKPLFEMVIDRKEGEMKHDRTGQVAPPLFPYPAKHENKADATRREQLAAWITSADNQYFAKSFTNRIWGYLTGTGIIEPLDDIRAGNPPGNPELLDYLTKEFIDSGFNTRHLIRLICRSRTYQLSISTNQWNEDDQSNFSHAKPRRLPAEVLYDTIYAVTGTQANIPGVPAGTRAAALHDNQINLADGFLNNLGRPVRESACECERSADLQMGPVMALISGPTVGDAISSAGNALHKLVAQFTDDRLLVNEIFLRVLGRPATEREIQTGIDGMGEIAGEHASLVKSRDARAAEIAATMQQKEQERAAGIEQAKNALAAVQAELAPAMTAKAQEQAAGVQQLRNALTEYEKGLPARQAEWEKAQQGQTGWTVLRAADADSTNKAKLDPQTDGSVAVSGKDGKTIYTVTGDTGAAQFTGLRLEALADDKLPAKGPGRSSGGNFVVSEFTAEWQPAIAPEWQPVKDWTFDSGAEGWDKPAALTVSPEAGRLKLDLHGRKATLTGAVTAPAGKYIAEVRLRGPQNLKQRLYWTTQTEPDFAETRAVAPHLTHGDDQWQILRYAFGTADDVTGLRLQTDNPDTTVLIDNIRLWQGEPVKPVVVKFKDAFASFNQGGYDVKGAIDGQAPAEGSGWAIYPDGVGKTQTAVFITENPAAIPQAPGILTVRINQQYSDGTHALGRFRISTTSAPGQLNFGLPAEISEFLAVAPDLRTPEQSQRLAAYFRSLDPEIARQEMAIAAAGQPIPEDPRIAEKKMALARAGLPVPPDAKLELLNRDVALSEAQLKEQRLTGAQDLTWALINSAAFLFNH